MVMTAPSDFLAHASPAELDGLYNNRLRVPHFPTLVAGWAQRSAAFRDQALAAGRAQLDLPYRGPRSGPAETMDVFHPRRARPNSPVLMFIHGGYWRSLDKADHSFVAQAFVEAGFTVAVPNYSLCPGTAAAPVSVELIALQMAHAVAWLRLSQGRPVVLAGHSAGGHLVAQLMACRWADVDPALGHTQAQPVLAGGVAVSGLFELESVCRTPYLNADLHLDRTAVARLSPAWMPAPTKTGPQGAGPLYALVGGDESPAFLAQNALIRQAWGRAAVPVCEALPGLNHFTVLEAFATPGQRAHELALSLLRR